MARIEDLAEGCLEVWILQDGISIRDIHLTLVLVSSADIARTLAQDFLHPGLRILRELLGLVMVARISHLNQVLAAKICVSLNRLRWLFSKLSADQVCICDHIC